MAQLLQSVLLTSHNQIRVLCYQIEDLFYNTPTRLAAVRNASEEYARILDVMTKYAVHNPAVSFFCKKVGMHPSGHSNHKYFLQRQGLLPLTCPLRPRPKRP
jgi:hypothetical protein